MSGSPHKESAALVRAQPQHEISGLAGPVRPQGGDAREPQVFPSGPSTLEEEAKRMGESPPLPLFPSFFPLPGSQPETSSSPAAAAEGEDKEPSPSSGEAQNETSSLQRQAAALSGAAGTAEGRRSQTWAESPLPMVGRLPAAAGPGAGLVEPGTQATAGVGTLGPGSPRLMIEPSVGRLGAPRSAQTLFFPGGKLGSLASREGAP